MSILSRVSFLTVFLLLNACASHKYTIVEPAQESLTSFNVLEIAPFTTALKDEDSTELSKMFAGRLFEEIQTHREKHADERIFEEITLSTNQIDDVLLMESKIISYEKGSRAKRYFFGLGSGKAYCTIQVIFKNKKTGLELARTNFDGELMGGVFGGDAEGTVDGVVKAFIDYMQEYMANSTDSLAVSQEFEPPSEQDTEGLSLVEQPKSPDRHTAECSHQLESLNSLLEDGIFSESEYQLQKKKLSGSGNC